MLMEGWTKISDGAPHITDLVVIFIPPCGYCFLSGSEYAGVIEGHPECTHFKVMAKCPEGYEEGARKAMLEILEANNTVITPGLLAEAIESPVEPQGCIEPVIASESLPETSKA